jgi:hypothetical protein
MVKVEVFDPQTVVAAQNIVADEIFKEECCRLCIGANVLFFSSFDAVRMEGKLFADGKPNTELVAKYFGSRIAEKCTEVVKCKAASTPVKTPKSGLLKWLTKFSHK